MTQIGFDAAMIEIRTQLLKMAGYVEEAILLATEALMTREAKLIDLVFQIEVQVNRLNKEVDETCLRILALQHPFAADLRLVIAIIKMNTDLERMGDHAVNIAHNAARYIPGKPFKALNDLPAMAFEVRRMVRQAIDSFVQRDAAMALEAVKKDDVVDSYKDKIFRDIIDLLKSRPDEVEQGLNLILISRNLEKIGDHASNVAENVIFAISGADIRHARAKAAPPVTGGPKDPTDPSGTKT